MADKTPPAAPPAATLPAPESWFTGVAVRVAMLVPEPVPVWPATTTVVRVVPPEVKVVEMEVGEAVAPPAAPAAPDVLRGPRVALPVWPVKAASLGRLHSRRRSASSPSSESESYWRTQASQSGSVALVFGFVDWQMQSISARSLLLSRSH